MSGAVDVLAALDREIVAIKNTKEMVDFAMSAGRSAAYAEHLTSLIEARAAVAELIEENKRLRVKAGLFDDLMAARQKTQAEPEDAEWKQVVRTEGLMRGVKACRAAHGFSLTEARDCVEAYLASVGSAS